MPEDLERELARAREEAATASEAAERAALRHRLIEAGMRVQIQQLADAQRRERDKVRRITGSRTWRLARFVVRLLRALRTPERTLRAARAKRSVRGLLGDPGPEPKPIEIARYEVSEDTRMRDAYERALAKRAFTGSGVRVAMAVQTTDLEEGRGDVYVAVGLGRYLERTGYEVVYLPRSRWYDLPAGTDVYVALLDQVDMLHVSPAITRIAWVRNRTTEWLASPSLALYDAVLCSSELTLADVRRSYPGTTALLRIGVDHELFSGAAEDERRRGVATTVNQWGTERQLFRALLKGSLDFPLAIYGEQRGLDPDLAPYWHGKTSFFALPSLYRQAALVLDDHNHTTQPFGNVNSRVYEAISCGAPLLTNSTLGLREIGLGDTLTYATPTELDDAVHVVLRDPEAIRPLVKSLQRKVLDEHTFERRAREFDEAVRAVRSTEPSEAPKDDRIAVGFFPDYRHTNPYQSMLYGWGTLPAIAPLPVPAPGPVANTALLRSGRPFVYHLHWTAPIIGSTRHESEARRRIQDFLEGIDALHAAGGSFVWTLHNVLPHECKFPELEGKLRQALADRADAVHVMCEATLAMTEPYYRLKPERVRVIPHPNYVGTYPNIVDQQTARAELGLRDEHTVLGFFGAIRSYKGIEELLDAFDSAARADDTLRLIVAGPTERLNDVEDLRARCTGDPRIVTNFNRIADADVQIFMNAADAIVLPHRSVLNSGSLMLALSFARPVIAPASGCVAELLTPDVSITFQAGDPASLRAAVGRARELRDERWRRAAFAKASEYDARAIAERFAGLVRDVSKR